MIEIRSCEAEELVAGADDRVLATEVLGHAIAVACAVVLDDQPRLWVIDVGEAEQAAGPVIEPCLHFWSRKSSLQQQKAEPGLHRRIGGLRERVMTAEAELHRSVRENKMLDWNKSLPQVTESSCHCGRAQPSNHNDVRWIDRVLPDQEAGSRSDTASRDFDWVNWIHVKAMKPRCGKPCEDCVRRKLVSPGDK